MMLINYSVISLILSILNERATELNYMEINQIVFLFADDFGFRAGALIEEIWCIICYWAWFEFVLCRNKREMIFRNISQLSLSLQRSDHDYYIYYFATKSNSANRYLKTWQVEMMR